MTRTLWPLLCALVAALALLATGCGAADESPTALLARDTASDLARRSDSVARSLDRGNSCAAAATAAALHKAVVQAIRDGRVPLELMAELTRRTEQLVDSIDCTASPSRGGQGASETVDDKKKATTKDEKDKKGREEEEKREAKEKDD